MLLIPHALRVRLAANAVRAAADGRFDPPPVVKLFNPMGAATWLATELGADGDTLFGLADLGFGCPELGYFSLGEIAAVRLPFALRVARDLAFASTVPLSRWAEAARRHGSIIAAEAALRRAAAPELPSGSPDG
nr:DUF2958 domain-containing protein [uncultured Sphingomonas sp.]